MSRIQTWVLAMLTMASAESCSYNYECGQEITQTYRTEYCADGYWSDTCEDCDDCDDSSSGYAPVSSSCSALCPSNSSAGSSSGGSSNSDTTTEVAGGTITRSCSTGDTCDSSQVSIVCEIEFDYTEKYNAKGKVAYGVVATSDGSTELKVEGIVIPSDKDPDGNTEFCVPLQTLLVVELKLCLQLEATLKDSAFAVDATITQKAVLKLSVLGVIGGGTDTRVGLGDGLDDTTISCSKLAPILALILIPAVIIILILGRYKKIQKAKRKGTDRGKELQEGTEL